MGLEISPASDGASKYLLLKKERRQNVTPWPWNNYKLKYQVECIAVDALVELTKVNIDALHSRMFPAQIGMRGSSY